MEKKQVLAVHESVTTHNYRIRISRPDPQVWILHIKSVRLSDAGHYMCQINTVPMRQQYGNLNVVGEFVFAITESSKYTALVIAFEKLQCLLRCSEEFIKNKKNAFGPIYKTLISNINVMAYASLIQIQTGIPLLVHF